MPGLTEANSDQWNNKNYDRHLRASVPWSLSIFAYLGISQKQFKASAQTNLQKTCAQRLWELITSIYQAPGRFLPNRATCASSGKIIMGDSDPCCWQDERSGEITALCYDSAIFFFGNGDKASIWGFVDIRFLPLLLCYVTFGHRYPQSITGKVCVLKTFAYQNNGTKVWTGNVQLYSMSDCLPTLVLNQWVLGWWKLENQFYH